jgi:hypothetical protein
MVHESHEVDVATGGARRQAGRLLATLIGVALLVVGAFLDWTPSHTGDKLNAKALLQPNFGGESDLVRTVGGLAILIGLVALIGLVDRTGWLTRLAGAAALVVFVMFAVEAYRVYGHDFTSAVHGMRAGAWLLLAGGVVMLIGGFFGGHEVVAVPTAVEDSNVHHSSIGQ